MTLSRCKIAAVVLFVFVAGLAGASASTVYKFTLPGVGTDIPVESFSFGAGVNTLSLTRNVDSFTPALSDVVAMGKPFATAELEAFDSSNPSTPSLEILLTDVLATSIQISSAGEHDSFSFRTVTEITPAPEPASVVLLASGLLAIGLRRRVR